MAQSVHRLAWAHLVLGHLAEAADAFREVIRIVEQKSDLVGLAYATFGLAETQLSAGWVHEASESIGRALAVTRKIHSPLLEGQITLSLARIERRRGALAAAVARLDDARRLFERTGSQLWQCRVAEELACWEREDATEADASAAVVQAVKAVALESSLEPASAW